MGQLKCTAAHQHRDRRGARDKRFLWQIVSLISIACAMMIASVACTHLPLLAQAPHEPNCRNLDWFEVGRNDGAMGAKADKVSDYVKRCEKTPYPFDQELYTGGRNAGLVEFCNSTLGFENGRAGTPYENVCPFNLEKSYLDAYHTGQRVRELELENVDLQARIENLNRLLNPNQTGSSVRAQIDQLELRRTSNGNTIDTLESSADSRSF